MASHHQSLRWITRAAQDTGPQVPSGLAPEVLPDTGAIALIRLI